MSLKNVCIAQCLRGQDFEERKGVLLEQIWLPGRLMEGLFPLSGSSCFMAQFDFHSKCVKVWGCPQALRGRPIVLKFALFAEGGTSVPC